MAAALHLVVNPPDALTREILDTARREPANEIVDLTDGEPDYPGLVAKIFQAETIATW